MEYKSFKCIDAKYIGLTLTDGTFQEWDLIYQYTANFEDPTCMLVTSLVDGQRKHLYVHLDHFDSIVKRIFPRGKLNLKEIQRQLFLQSL